MNTTESSGYLGRVADQLVGQFIQGFIGRFTGIDVTITHVSNGIATTSSPKPSLIYRTHLASIRNKLHGRGRDNKPSAAIINEINHTNHLLVPFTVDHLGGLGRYALSFLFDEHDSPIPICKLDIAETYNFTHHPAATAYTRMKSDPLRIASLATHEWTKTHGKLQFGTTYHSQTPSNWALQSLSLNIVRGLADFLQKSLRGLSKQTAEHNARRPTQARPVRVYGPTPYLPTNDTRVLLAANPQPPRTYHTAASLDS